MVNVNNMFPSKWVKAADLQGKEIVVTIDRLGKEEVEQGAPPKYILYFEGKNKGMVLNKTNTGNLATIHGPESDGWIGKQIQLFSTFVDFKGESVEAISIKAVAPASVAPPVPEHDSIDDEIPF